MLLTTAAYAAPAPASWTATDPDETIAAESAIADAALLKLEAAFIWLTNLLFSLSPWREETGLCRKTPYDINRIFPTRKAAG